MSLVLCAFRSFLEAQDAQGLFCFPGFVSCLPSDKGSKPQRGKDMTTLKGIGSLVPNWMTSSSPLGLVLVLSQGPSKEPGISPLSKFHYKGFFYFFESFIYNPTNSKRDFQTPSPFVHEFHSSN